MSDASKVDYGYWAKMAYWSIEEASALMVGIDPCSVGGFSSTPAMLASAFGTRFARKMALVQRAVDFGLLALPLVPVEFKDWANAAGLSMPQELISALASCSRYPRRGTTAFLKAGGSQTGDESTEMYNKKSVNTLLKMVGGMAMAVYGYEPGGGRSNVVSEIQTDLDLKGINLDLDTIRKWLREAGSLLSTRELHAAKPK